MSSLWHLLVGGYIREQVNVLSSQLMLEAGKLSEFDKRPNCDGYTTLQELLINCRSCRVFSVCRGQYLLKVVQ